MDDDLISAAIRGGLRFLRAEQLPNGEFRTLVGGWAEGQPDLSRAVFDSSPFVTSFVLYALTHAAPGEADEMIQRAVAFLKADMGPGGHWRYWSKAQHKHYRLPPDLDDTACASFALRAAGARVPRNAWVFRQARDAQGRFLTWLSHANTTRRSLRLKWSEAEETRLRAGGDGPPQSPAQEDPRFNPPVYDPNDVDPVVNANAALYLGEGPLSRPAISYVQQLISSGLPERYSLYYLDPIFLYHAVARAYRHSVPSFGALGHRIVAEIERGVGRQGRFDTPLIAACAASVLLTFSPGSPALSLAMAQIIEAQQDTGGWPAAPFYLCWGSRELTTALCLESLLRAQGASG